MITRLAIVAVWAEDAAQAAHFYRDAFGLRLLPHHWLPSPSMTWTPPSNACARTASRCRGDRGGRRLALGHIP